MKIVYRDVKNQSTKSKIPTKGFKHTVMAPKDTEGISNSVDLDQTGTIRCRSALSLFAHTYLFENF